MAKMLFKEGGFKILSDNVGELSGDELIKMIKTAGTTCYQTRETSKKTPVEFVKMLQKSGHLAMIEHSWRTVEIRFKLGYYLSKEEVGFRLYKANNLFCITARPERNSLIISGNVRMFNEAWIKDQTEITGSILSVLSRENLVLFPKPECGFKESVMGDEVIPNPVLKNKKEILVHRAMTVEFNNNSRGMTHETVRSRNGDEKITSYAQESTRYVDYAKGELDLEAFQMQFILPYNDLFDFNQRFKFSVSKKDYDFTPQEFTNLMESWYRTLRKNGLRPEEARQWLPIGLKAQIVQTYNLNEWRHWFSIRAGKAAHPEIRFLAVNLLKETQKRIPGCFDDFQISKDGKSAKYVGDGHLV